LQGAAGTSMVQTEDKDARQVASQAAGSAAAETKATTAAAAGASTTTEASPLDSFTVTRGGTTTPTTCFQNYMYNVSTTASAAASTPEECASSCLATRTCVHFAWSTAIKCRMSSKCFSYTDAAPVDGYLRKSSTSKDCASFTVGNCPYPHCVWSGSDLCELVSSSGLPCTNNEEKLVKTLDFSDLRNCDKRGGGDTGREACRSKVFAKVAVSPTCRDAVTPYLPR